MPTYSYRCVDCAHRYDAFQSMSEAAHTVCPECNGKVERLISGGAGIVFKGSGFYVTDYRKSPKGGEGGSSSESGSSTAPAGSNSSPSKGAGSSSASSSSAASTSA